MSTNSFRIPRLPRAGGESLTWLTTGMLLAAGSLYPAPRTELLITVLSGLGALLPVVLLAALLTGALSVGRWSERVMATVRGKPARAIVLASFAGAVTPVCGLGVLPLIAALLRRGLPLAPVMAFWVSSPVMGPSMLVVTLGVLGWQFAAAKALAALGVGLMAGTVTALLPGYRGPVQDLMRPEQLTGVECGDDRFWTEAWHGARLVLRWLALALVLEVLLQRLVPVEWIKGTFGVDNTASVLLAAVVGAPLYIDGYAALPFVRGLMEMGMGFGAALAFMISGAAVSLYAAVAVAAIVRARVFALYVALAVLGAVVAGYAAHSVAVLSAS